MPYHKRTMLDMYESSDTVMHVDYGITLLKTRINVNKILLLFVQFTYYKEPTENCS